MMRGEHSTRCHPHFASRVEWVSLLPPGGWFLGLRDTPTPVSFLTPPLLRPGIGVRGVAAATWPPEAVPPGAPGPAGGPCSVRTTALQVFCSVTQLCDTRLCRTQARPSPRPQGRNEGQKQKRAPVFIACIPASLYLWLWGLDRSALLPVGLSSSPLKWRDDLETSGRTCLGKWRSRTPRFPNAKTFLNHSMDPSLLPVITNVQPWAHSRCSADPRDPSLPCHPPRQSAGSQFSRG